MQYGIELANRCEHKKYYALAWPSTLRTFKNNLETIHQYSDSGFKLIMNGEVGRYENTRLTVH